MIAQSKYITFKKFVVSVEKCPNYCTISNEKKVIKTCEHLGEINELGDFKFKIKCNK